MSSEFVDTRKFNVPLTAGPDLHLQLMEFKKACDAYEKHRSKRCKRRYYNLGLMAHIVADTTYHELKCLLKNGARTFFLDIVTNKPKEFQQIVARINTAIGEYQLEDPFVRFVTGLAVEITGECCRIGRMRNNCSVLMQRGQFITLTIDEAYKYSCFREIAYVFNLKHFLAHLKLCDEIVIGREVRGKVVKLLKDSVAIRIEEAGILSSYKYIELPNQCYMLPPQNFTGLYKEELQIAAEAKANYIIVPNIRCKAFLKSLRKSIKNGYDFQLIGSLDLEYIRTKMMDLMGTIKLLDYLWISDAFSKAINMQNYIYEDVIPMAKCLKKPIIGSVPLESFSDFRRFENHQFLWKIDSILIEKSQWCKKYPLIVKKLLPIHDFRLAVVENRMALKSILTSYRSIVNFIIRTISSIECQAIIMHTKCETAAVALGRVEIYCPVYMMLPVQEEQVVWQMKLVRALNLRRNILGILYTPEANECHYKPIEFGIDYVRRKGLLDTGDFIITLEVGKEDEDEDVAILRTFYLPPKPIAEKFKYA